MCCRWSLWLCCLPVRIRLGELPGRLSLGIFGRSEGGGWSAECGQVQVVVCDAAARVVAWVRGCAKGARSSVGYRWCICARYGLGRGDGGGCRGGGAVARARSVGWLDRGRRWRCASGGSADV